jgi:hypothetical protein
MNFNIELDGRTNICGVTTHQSYLVEKRELEPRTCEFGIEPSAFIGGGEFLD